MSSRPSSTQVSQGISTLAPIHHHTRIVRQAHRRRIVPVVANRHHGGDILLLLAPDARHRRPAAQPLAVGAASLDHDVVERELPVRMCLDGRFFRSEPAHLVSAIHFS